MEYAGVTVANAKIAFVSSDGFTFSGKNAQPPERYCDQFV
jgi:hypothetical protein